MEYAFSHKSPPISEANFAFSHNYPIIFNEAEFNILWQNLENVDKNDPKYNFISMIAEFENV